MRAKMYPAAIKWGVPFDPRPDCNVPETSYREISGRHYWFLWRDFLAPYAQIAFQPAPKS